MFEIVKRRDSVMSRTTIIKTAISVFCLIALVLLYVFGGRVIEDDNAVYEANQASFFFCLRGLDFLLFPFMFFTELLWRLAL